MSANVFATTDVVPLRGSSDLFELAFGHLYGDGDHALVPFRQHVETVVDRAGDTVAGILAFHSFHVTADLLLGHSEFLQQFLVSFVEIAHRSPLLPSS